ncbi:unnamed protein product [Sphagnum troendelagicum]|jgi:hypothetical protein|uniref:Uncharacterized protein n=2 Tax=Sphagnum TaxID=13804 RepID=A0ABP0V2Y0_9BRYO
MALNTVATVSHENTVAYNGKVGHNSVTECQSSSTEGSTSVTEKQNSGTEGSKSIPGKHNLRIEEQEFKWKPELPKSEWIGKLESRLSLDSTASYDESYPYLVMKLADFQRKPEEHYTPQQWRFGLHNRDLQTSTTIYNRDLQISTTVHNHELQTSTTVHNPDLQTFTTVGSTTESEALKISLAAAYNLSHRWEEFCDDVVPRPENIALRSYGLHSGATNFTRKEVQSLLTLDALTLLLVLSSSALPDSFQSSVEIPGSAIRALLKGGAAYGALRNDLFLCENQIPLTLLKKVIKKCYFLHGKNSCSDIVLKDPHKDLRKEYLHNILKNLVCKMCTEIFVQPCSTVKDFRKSLDDHVGYFDGCAHIFACVYKLLTNFNIELQMSTFVEVNVELNGVHQVIMPPIENERDWNELRKDCEKGADRSKIEPGRKVRHTKRTEFDFNKIPHQHHSPTSDSEEEGTQPEQQSWRKGPLRSATDLKKAGLRIETKPGMVQQVFFEDGCLYLPIVQLHDRTESYFRNLATYEVFDQYDQKRHAFRDYLHLMSDLIKTQEDVAYLIDDCKVIRNLLGTHKNAFEMWDRLQSGLLPFRYSPEYREKIVDPINAQCDSPLNKIRTEFYDKFCSKPWFAISVITAAVLLLATLIQTYVSVIGSDKMQPHFPRGG